LKETTKEKLTSMYTLKYKRKKLDDDEDDLEKFCAIWTGVSGYFCVPMFTGEHLGRLASCKEE